MPFATIYETTKNIKSEGRRLVVSAEREPMSISDIPSTVMHVVYWVQKLGTFEYIRNIFDPMIEKNPNIKYIDIIPQGKFAENRSIEEIPYLLLEIKEEIKLPELPKLPDSIKTFRINGQDLTNQYK